MIKRFKEQFKALLLAGLFILPQELSAQNQSNFTPAQNAAQKAYNEKDFTRATTLANEMLRRNPNDMFALIMLAAIERQKGNFNTALTFSKKAFKIANTKDEKYTAAVLASHALRGQKKYERAKLWLRRASQHAPSSNAKRTVARSFQQVRAASPWRTNLQFGVSPSDNVNNGTDARIFYSNLGFPFSIENADPLEGIVAQFSGAVDYRIKSTPNSRLVFGADLYHRHVTLSSDARENSIYKGSDFNYTFFGLHLRNTHVFSETNTVFTQNLGVGRAWSKRPIRDSINGEDFISSRPVEYKNSLSYDARIQKTLNRTVQIGGSLSFNNSTDPDDNTNSYDRVGFTIFQNRFLKNGARVGFNLRFADTRSPRSTVANYATHLSASYTPKRPVLGLSPTYSITYGIRNDKELSFPGLRRDKSIKLRGSFAIPTLEFYGFRPQAVFEWRKNMSNIPLYETKEFKAQLMMVSSF